MLRTQCQVLKRRPGFTLLELIVVITIIGLLGTLVVTRVAPILFKANRTKVNFDLQAIHGAAEQFLLSMHHYPESIDELVNAKDESGNDVPGSLTDYPKDPWRNEYGYELGESGPRVFCLGKDQQPGGSGDDEDLEYPKADAR